MAAIFIGSKIWFEECHGWEHLKVFNALFLTDQGFRKSSSSNRWRAGGRNTMGLEITLVSTWALCYVLLINHPRACLTICSPRFVGRAEQSAQCPKCVYQAHKHWSCFLDKVNVNTGQPGPSGCLLPPAFSNEFPLWGINSLPYCHVHQRKQTSPRLHESKSGLLCMHHQLQPTLPSTEIFCPGPPDPDQALCLLGKVLLIPTGPLLCWDSAFLQLPEEGSMVDDIFTCKSAFILLVLWLGMGC